MKKVPELRFPEFNGEWEEKNLGDIATIKTGNTNVQDAVDDGKYVFFDRSVIVKKIDKYDYDEETIIYPGEGSEFYPRYYQGKYALHQRAYSITSEVVNLKYLSNIMMSKNNHFLKMAVGSTVKSLRMDNFTECRISMPSSQEQEKLANFFSLIDKKIEKQEEKIASMEEYKKGMMQKLFPKKGENVPELRFKGFTDPWEQRRLGEVVEVLDGDRGKNYPSGDDFFEHGNTLFLSATNVTKNGFSFETNQYITEEKSNALGNGKLDLNDIVLTSRGSLGHIAWYNSDVRKLIPFARINSGMLILRSKEELEPSYITQYLKSPLGQRQIDLISFGSAQPQLTKKDVLNYNISIPQKDEQAKLGTFFSNVNHLITLHQRKLEELKEIKKGLMQKMFI